MSSPKIRTAVDHFAELLHPFTTSERVTQPVHNLVTGRWITTTRIHYVTHLALLDQIDQTVTAHQCNGEVFHAVYGSKPAGRIDCLAFLERIERQSKRTAIRLGVPVLPLRPRLSRIGGIIGDVPNGQVKHWWTTARVLTAHDSAAYTPNIPCPELTCERWGTIRVRLDPNIAVCVECSTSWSGDDGTFGLLTRWSEWASEHLRGPRHWVGDDETTGYPQLGYLVECPVCAAERLDMARREAGRLRAIREPYGALSAPYSKATGMSRTRVLG